MRRDERKEKFYPLGQLCIVRMREEVNKPSHIKNLHNLIICYFLSLIKIFFFKF